MKKNSYYKLLFNHIKNDHLMIVHDKCSECGCDLFSIEEKIVCEDKNKKLIAKFICPKCKNEYEKEVTKYSNISKYKCDIVNANN